MKKVYYYVYSYIDTRMQMLQRADWRSGLAHLTRDRWIPVSREFEPHQSPRCFLEQETLFSLLSTGWFQERIRA